MQCRLAGLLQECRIVEGFESLHHACEKDRDDSYFPFERHLELEKDGEW